MINTKSIDFLEWDNMYDGIDLADHGSMALIEAPVVPEPLRHSSLRAPGKRKRSRFRSSSSAAFEIASTRRKVVNNRVLPRDPPNRKKKLIFCKHF